MDKLRPRTYLGDMGTEETNQDRRAADRLANPRRGAWVDGRWDPKALPLSTGELARRRAKLMRLAREAKETR